MNLRMARLILNKRQVDLKKLTGIHPPRLSSALTAFRPNSTDRAGQDPLRGCNGRNSTKESTITAMSWHLTVMFSKAYLLAKDRLERLKRKSNSKKTVDVLERAPDSNLRSIEFSINQVIDQSLKKIGKSLKSIDYTWQSIEQTKSYPKWVLAASHNRSVHSSFGDSVSRYIR